MPDFIACFEAARTEETPQGLQLLFFAPPMLEADAIAAMLNELPGVAGASCDLVRVADVPDAAKLVSDSGPPASVLGLVEWFSSPPTAAKRGDLPLQGGGEKKGGFLTSPLEGEVDSQSESGGGAASHLHTIKLVQFDEPMPYGPVESCVGPAMLPPPMKVDASQHQAHVLLYYAGAYPDTLERFAALCAVAGALARFDAITVLNEEARAAAPVSDLVPDSGEDAMETYRTLPIPYLLGGFVKMDAGNAERPWVRTFANHRLGLPNLARQLAGHDQTASTFQLFAGMLGYLRTMGETFTAGDAIDLGDGAKFSLREPTEAEWFLDSVGPMLVITSIE